MAIQYHETTGAYLHTNDTIEAMLDEFEDGAYMLEDFQVEFIESLGKFYRSRGYLTPKQFAYLAGYYNIDHSFYPDPADERRYID